VQTITEVPVIEPLPAMLRVNSVVFESVTKIFGRGLFFSRKTGERTVALNGISLDVSVGEVLGLLGPNGSGKSTTLKLISTTLLPDAGRVAVNGSDTQLQGTAVRNQVGFALASERSFFPRLTVHENLDFFAALEDIPRRERRIRIESVLYDTGLMPSANEQVMKLSSGTYQRLGIARALIKRSSVLLLDEPSRSLDPVAAEQLWQLVRGLSNSGITVILATHSFAEAVTVCDRVAILQSGELLAVRRAGILSAERLRKDYLEITSESESSRWTEGVTA
jgi:ABC-2 type transport system ATP-binding protein